MFPSRRDALRAACAAAVPSLARPAQATEADPRGPLGIVIHSCAIRGRDPAFREPVRFLDYARGLGAAAIQVGLGVLSDSEADALRERGEAAGIALEGIASLPRAEADLEHFEAELRAARRAGATIVRTVTLSGRRYETFDSLAAFRRFRDEARSRLKLAAPAAARAGVRLAVENHKDWRADELIALLREVGHEALGVCLDTGNSMALLEEPHAVVEALAPRALTTHFKDMAVEESRDGFLLSEVPLGDGDLDLPRIARTLRTEDPAIRLNLEMITRDPLAIPCLTDAYWATLPELPGRDLARTLAAVRRESRPGRLPRISGLIPDDQLRREDANNRRSFDYARDHLSMSP